MPDPCNFVELHLHVSFKHLLQFHKACIGGSSRFTKINSQLLEDLGRWPNRHECHAIPKKKRFSNIVCDKHYCGSVIVPNPCQLALQCSASNRVKCSKWLILQQQLRFHDQVTGVLAAMQLAPGELNWELVFRCSQ